MPRTGNRAPVARGTTRRPATGPPPFVARPWGGFSTLAEGPGYQVKRLVIEPGHRFSLQKHRRRAEHWVVVSGSPVIVVGRRTRRLRPRDAITIKRGAWHRAGNPGRVPVVIVEVQHGSYLGEDDIVRKQDDYGRGRGSRDHIPHSGGHP